MTAADTTGDNGVDDHVDDEIIGCLNLAQPKSFFLFAGAGSGKTRSLVKALNQLRNSSGTTMWLHGEQIGVITYTNAACDEIIRRLDFDPLVHVSTIHSFVWELIRGFDADIRKWLVGNLATEIAELQELARKGRPGTKTATERLRNLEAKQRRLAALPSIRRFLYSPTGDNRGRDSLSHAEVIKIGSTFLNDKPVMQNLLITRYPILLVDESQDTNGLLLDSLLAVQKAHKARFALGLIGDLMQRIYSDGKVDLGRELPPDWAKPAKLVNHRCPRRVVRLINKIRTAADTHVQQPRTDAVEGHVRLFIAPGAGNHFQIEEQAKTAMAAVTGDPCWTQQGEVKTLILEHHMAAKRMGFFEMFEPLYGVDSFKTGLRDGSLPLLRFFSDMALPLVKAKASGNEFAAMAVVRKWSTFLREDQLEAAGVNQLAQLGRARTAVEKLMSLFSAGAQPRCLDVLRCIADSKLFDIPDALYPFASAEAPTNTSGDPVEDGPSDDLESVRRFLDAPFAQIEPYSIYVKGEAAFGTHQGVKGLEFPRVLVVMDDEGAGGFLFSYEKLFGAKDKSAADIENERIGKDTAIDRTRRLFYVTCSRSKESLAIVAYSSRPDRLQAYAIDQGWFDANEIQVLG